MAQRTDGGQGIFVRNALHACPHPALLLDRFRQSGRPAAGCRQHQHISLVRARRSAAFGEGVGLYNATILKERVAAGFCEEQCRRPVSLPGPVYDMKETSRQAEKALRSGRLSAAVEWVRLKRSYAITLNCTSSNILTSALR